MCQQIPAASHSSNFVNLSPQIPAVGVSRNYVNIPIPEDPPIQAVNCPEYDINSAYRAQQQSNCNFAAGSQSQ